MKNIKILFLLAVGLTFAQEPKIKFRSLDFGFGFYQTNKILLSDNNNDFIRATDGISGIVNLSFDIQKNLIAITYIGGAEFCILCGKPYRFNEIKIQYGREIKPSKNVVLDVFAGLGYFSFYRSGNYPYHNESISIPITGNMKFYFNKLFGMGLNMNYSINKIGNNFSTNLIFTFRFNN